MPHHPCFLSQLLVRSLGVLLVGGLPPLAGQADPEPAHPQEYTLAMTEAHLQQILSHPMVGPTPMGAAINPTEDGLAACRIGTTPGTAQGGYFWKGKEVPRLGIYGVRLSDGESARPKVAIVVQGGNHSNETHSLHAMEGMIAYFLSGEVLARKLLSYADVFYYPQIHPEGRWAYQGTSLHKSAGGPEHPDVDNNRHWHEPDEPMGVNNRPWSHVRIVQEAQRFDTNGLPVEAFFDFHSPTTLGDGVTEAWTYSYFEDRKLEWMRQIDGPEQDWEYRTGLAPLEATARSYGIRSRSEGGLGSGQAYAPEIGERPTIADYHAIGEWMGRSLALQITEDRPTRSGNGEFLLDFNNREAPFSNGWNKIGEADLGQTLPLIDSAGNATDVRVTLPPGSASASAGWQNTDSLPDWLAEQAANDYLYFSNRYNYLYLDFSGLRPNGVYDLSICSSRDLDRGMTVTAGDDIIPAETGDFLLSAWKMSSGDPVLSWNNRADGFEGQRILVLPNVRANAAGRLRVQFSELTSGGSNKTVALNAMRLRPDFEDSFAAWAGERNLPAGKDGPFDSFPDEDVANILKYAFGDSAAADGHLRIRRQDEGDSPRLEFPYEVSANAHGVVVEPFMATGLEGATWTRVAPSQIRNAGFSGDREQFSVTVPLPADAPLFMRLQVLPFGMEEEDAP